MPYNEGERNDLPLYYTVAATLLYFIVPFTIVLVLYLLDVACSMEPLVVVHHEHRVGFPEAALLPRAPQPQVFVPVQCKVEEVLP